MKTREESPGKLKKLQNCKEQLPFNKGNKRPLNKGSDHGFNRAHKPSFKRQNKLPFKNENVWNNRPNQQNFNREKLDNTYKPRFNKPWQQGNRNIQQGDNEKTATNETNPRNEKFLDVKLSQVNTSASSESKAKLKVMKNKLKKVKDEIEPNFEDAKAKKKFFYRTLLVENLESTIDKVQLLKLFSRYGKILHVVMKTPKRNKSLLAQSFVVFQKRQEALKAVEVDGLEYQGHCLKVQLCDNSKYDENKAVVVTNLPAGTQNDDLCVAFKSCGPILNVHLLKNKQREVTGTGYVNFESENSVALALQMKDVLIKNQEVQIKEQKGVGIVQKQLKGPKKSSKKIENNESKNILQKTTKNDKGGIKKKTKEKRKRVHKTKNVTLKLDPSS